MHTGQTLSNIFLQLASDNTVHDLYTHKYNYNLQFSVDHSGLPELCYTSPHAVYTTQQPPLSAKQLVIKPTLGWRGGATVGRRTSGCEAVGSIPGRGVAA